MIEVILMISINYLLSTLLISLIYSTHLSIILINLSFFSFVMPLSHVILVSIFLYHILNIFTIFYLYHIILYYFVISYKFVIGYKFVIVY